MKFCIECGTQLIEKNLEQEGVVPYCTTCQQYRFPTYNVAVSVIILNPERDKILLIQQYGYKRNILVAGYVNLGESPEEAVVRECYEETGLRVSGINYTKSKYYERTNTLMLNYSCQANDEILNIDQTEVDYAAWYSIEDARNEIFSDSLAEEFLLAFLTTRNDQFHSENPL